MSESGHFEVSDDRSTASATFELAPPGVYDAEKQLTSQQIIDMKQLFKNDRGGLDTFASRSVARIALRLVMRHQFPRPDNNDEYLTLEELESADPKEPIEDMNIGDLLEIVDEAAGLAASWQEGLDEAINLPGDEWPEGMTPPATFVEPLLSDEVVKDRTDHYNYNIENIPEWVAKQANLFESVTGIRLDVKGLNSDVEEKDLRSN